MGTKSISNQGSMEWHCACHPGQAKAQGQLTNTKETPCLLFSFCFGVFFCLFLLIFKRENVKIRKKGRWGDDLGVEGGEKKNREQ